MVQTFIRNILDLHWNKVSRCFDSKVFKVLVLLALVLAPLYGQAQMNLQDHDNKKIHFGILLGFNSTRFHVTHSNDFIKNDSIYVLESPTTPGFNLGIVSNFQLTPRIDLRVIPTLIFAEKDLRYVVKGSTIEGDPIDPIESIYLDLPIGIKYKSDRFYNNFRFYVLAGGKIDFDMASNSKKRRANDIVKLSQFDYSAEVGFGFEFYFPLFIFSPEFKIANGLNNVHSPTPTLIYSDVIDKLRSRTFTISLQFEG